MNHFCKVVSEFALEYRTTRDKVQQMLEKKANQRERKKTRGKMIVDVSGLPLVKRRAFKLALIRFLCHCATFLLFGLSSPTQFVKLCEL